MRSMEDILGMVCGYLNERGVNYVIVGGIAVIAYGTPRTTMDADFIIQMEIGRLKEFARFLRTKRFFSEPDEIEAAIREKSHFSATDKDSLFRLDIKGVYNDMDWRTMKNRRAIEYRGTKMFLASPEDTIANKLVFGSEQDIKDAESIYVRQLLKLDMSYIEAACVKMGVLDEFKKMRLRVDRHLKEMESAKKGRR